MNFKKVIILSILLAIFTMGAVCAAADAVCEDHILTTEDMGCSSETNEKFSGEMLSIYDEKDSVEKLESSNGDKISESESINEESLQTKDMPTFDNLDHVITCSTDVAILEGDFTFNSALDNDYVNGVGIHRDNLIIEGKNHTINGSSLARIFNVTGNNVTLQNIVFVNGFSNNGGTLHITGSDVRIINCTFIGGNASIDGGAIYVRAPNVIIDNSRFINNTAVYNGAVYMNSANGIVSGSYFENNVAGISAGAFGWARKDNGTVDNCTFINNSAHNEGGGAIFWNTGLNGKIINSRFEDNYANFNGSAIFLCDGENNIISNCTFTNNNATVNGGAIYATGTLVVYDSFFAGNCAEDGGAIYAKAPDSLISNSRFIGNAAVYNGAVYMNSANGIVTGSYFENNVAGISAGALGWVRKDNGTVDNCTFISNDAFSQGGGAIFWNTGLNGKIINSRFEDNYAGINGGAIFWCDAENGSISNCSFTDNNASISGGALTVMNKSCTVEDCEFTGNSAVNGGAIYEEGITELNVINSLFEYNAADVGGAIDSYGNLTISNVSFKNNTASDGNNDIALKGNATVKYVLNLNVVGIKDNIYGKTMSIEVNATSDIAVNDGNVSIMINNKSYVAPVKNGMATVEIPDLDAGNYSADIAYNGDEMFVNNVKTIDLTVLKQNAKIEASNKAYVINYGGKYSVTLKDAEGKVIAGKKVTFTLNGKVIGSAATNANGVATITLTAKTLKTAKAGKKNLVIKFDDSNYNAASKAVKITINKEKAKITAKKKSFKKSKKVKKYTITLKNSKSKAIKKAKVTLKVKGKTYRVKTNSKGKATFKITNLKKKGSFTATVKFAGDKYYKKATKKVKISVK